MIPSPLNTYLQNKMSEKFLNVVVEVRTGWACIGTDFNEPFHHVSLKLEERFQQVCLLVLKLTFVRISAPICVEQ